MLEKRISNNNNALTLPFREFLSLTAFDLPKNLQEKDWRDIGSALGRMRGSMQWWLGDWWRYADDDGKSKHRYGDRKAMVENEDWDGPEFQTCADVAYVCRAFAETSRRREVLSFIHHREVAGLCEKNPDIADRLLDWCEEPIAATGKPRTIRELREEVRKAKSFVAQGWTQDQLDRKTRALNRECVVASMREIDGRRRDDALLAWAEAENRLVRIDRQTEWGNPFEMPDDGDREEVVGKYSKFYLPHKNGLLLKMPSLRGKVLVCWCHPQECHGHIIAEIVNREAAGEGPAASIADAIAEVDG
jgi:Domain of unknown function (DUF4326)